MKSWLAFMLLNLKQILLPAKQHGFAVGAFNVTESTMFKAVVEQAEALKAPVIIQVSPNEFEFCDRELYHYFVERLQHSPNPFVLHYDHGKTYEGCVRAVQAGFSSVMFDGSHLPYEENVRAVCRVVEMAHAANVSVEGEIGSIGETDNFDAGTVKDMIYSTPEDALRFSQDTGVDALAVSIGTVHGLMPKGYVPVLQIQRLRKIAAAVDVPLVLHGGSCTPADEVSEACRSGISKVNVSSEFKNAYYQSVKDFVLANPSKVSPTLVAKGAVEQVRRIVHEKLDIFGTVGMAGYYQFSARGLPAGANLPAAD